MQRSHRTIIQDYGASKLRRDLAAMGVELSVSGPQRWADRNSIPGEYWPTVSHLTGVTVDELAEMAEAAKLPHAAEARRASEPGRDAA